MRISSGTTAMPPLNCAVISVDCLERSLTFYRDVIGLDVLGTGTVTEEGFADFWGVPARSRIETALLGIKGLPVGQVLLVSFAQCDRELIRRPSERTTRGFWNVNFYVADMKATVIRLRNDGFAFWSEPVSYVLSPAAGAATEVLFEGPDGVAINLVQPEGDPGTFTARIKAEVAAHGWTRTGYTPVCTTAHCVHDIEAATRFYKDILGMSVVLDEKLSKPETNRFLCRPADAATHTVFLSGGHFFGKISLNQPLNYSVPERVASAHAPNIGYIAQAFEVEGLDAAIGRYYGLAGLAPAARNDFELPGMGLIHACRLAIPGSGASAFVYAAAAQCRIPAT